MKVVLNLAYGRFKLPKKFCEMYGMNKYDHIDRTDERLVSFVEENRLIELDCFCLQVFNIPDAVTAWEIVKHDGLESITCVMNGKICHVY